MAELRIRLQPKQSELWKLWDESDVTRIGFGGARGGSKSGGGRRCMLLRRLKYPKTTGLILRRTYGELYKSHLIKLFEEYPVIRNWWDAGHKAINFPNGSILFFGYAEHEADMSSFYSAEFADIMPDEAQEFSQGELERLSGSLRCTSNYDIVPKMVMTFMPGMSEAGLAPVGLPYLKRVFPDGKLQGEELKRKWQFIQAFGWDNIEWARKELAFDGVSEDEFYSWSEAVRREYFTTRTDYGANIAALTNKYLRDAWLYGKWDVFQGQYFPNWSPSRQIITLDQAKAMMRPWHKKWISGDWGFEHPNTVYWHNQDETGRVITYRELWAREMGETEIGSTVTARSVGERILAFPYSWDAFGKLNKTTHQPITDMIGAAMSGGMPKPFPADKSPGSRISGWRLMYQLIDSGMWLVVGEECPHLVECIPTLIRDPENPEDVLKVDYPQNHIGDDPADAVRYGLQYMLGAANKPRDVLLEERLQSVRKGFAGKGDEALPGSDPFAQFGGRKFN